MIFCIHITYFQLNLSYMFHFVHCLVISKWEPTTIWIWYIKIIAAELLLNGFYVSKFISLMLFRFILFPTTLLKLLVSKYIKYTDTMFDIFCVFHVSIDEIWSFVLVLLLMQLFVLIIITVLFNLVRMLGDTNLLSRMFNCSRQLLI